MVKGSEKSARVQAVSPTLSSHSFRRYAGASLLDVGGPILDVLDGRRRKQSQRAPWEVPCVGASNIVRGATFAWTHNHHPNILRLESLRSAPYQASALHQRLAH